MINLGYYDIGILGSAIATIVSIFFNKEKVSLSLMLVLFFFIILKLIYGGITH